MNRITALNLALGDERANRKVLEAECEELRYELAKTQRALRAALSQAAKPQATHWSLFSSTGNLIEDCESEAQGRARMKQIVAAEPEAAAHIALLSFDADGMCLDVVEAF